MALFYIVVPKQPFRDISQSIFTVLGTYLLNALEKSSMLQNMNFHVSLTYGSFSSTLSGRETRQVNPSWAKDVLGSAAPTKSRAVHLLGGDEGN